MGNLDDSSSLISGEFLKSIYFDATQTVRHYDGLRASFTQFFASILAIASSGVAAAAVQNSMLEVLPIITGTLAALSLISLLVVLKIDSLIKLQRNRARIAMECFQNTFQSFDLISINRNSKEKMNHLALPKVSLGRLWAGLFMVVFLMNFSLFVVFLSL